ncbi:MAG: redoxin domain-containing protein [Deltaproteobacteria bacterium]|nr:redoxin domain-containing protein [Deltaproteobacteria bacterium]
MTAVAAKYADIQKLNVEILAISVDSVFAHKTWQEQELSKMVKGGIPYPMLSDAGGQTGETYGVYDADAGVNIRGQFIIDPDGIIQGTEVLNSPVGRNVGELIRQLEAFQCVRESKGTEATPAGWQPGKQTLKPSPDLVCKVCTVWDSE